MLVNAYANALSTKSTNTDLWLTLAAAVPPGVTWRGEVSNDQLSPSFIRLTESIGPDASPQARQLAIAALARHPLLVQEQVALAESISVLGPMELTNVLALLRPVHDESVNRALVEAISSSDQIDSLPASLLDDHFRDHPAIVKAIADSLISRLSGDAMKGRREHLQRLMEDMPEGDALRGFQVFRSSKAACSACHAVGYFGGKIGPDLTRINRIRTEQDLIEAIVYPSASFVRSYESVQVMTDDGRAVSGLIANEDAESITLTTGIDQRVRVQRDEIEAFRPSPVSIMPAGLDQQLSPQELADLIRFLKTER
jgi:putative heme-binding domain-containing protein